MTKTKINNCSRFLLFGINEGRYALPVHAIERVIRAVEVTPLPKAPEIVIGVINIEGDIIGVVSIRRRFCHPEQETRVTDQFIIAHTSMRRVALVVDFVTDVVEVSGQDIVKAERILSGLSYIEGAVRRKDGLILISDLDRLLSLDEEKVLDKAVGNIQKDEKE
jgi:purine-binding chemotaxis protein CheW